MRFPRIPSCILHKKTGFFFHKNGKQNCVSNQNVRQSYGFSNGGKDGVSKMKRQ